MVVRIKVCSGVVLDLNYYIKKGTDHSRVGQSVPYCCAFSGGYQRPEWFSTVV